MCLFLIFCYKLRFRLENVYMSICWYKWLFWLCELAMMPLMFNIAWLGNCKFYTLRDALVLADCAEDGNHWPNIMIVAVVLCFAIVFVYNYVLLKIVLSSLISIDRHEQHIRKKEVESVLRISTMWRTQKYFTFSSFRNGVPSIFHRIYFNMLAVVIVLLEVGMVSEKSVDLYFRRTATRRPRRLSLRLSSSPYSRYTVM